MIAHPGVVPKPATYVVGGPARGILEVGSIDLPSASADILVHSE